ncbi:hypothetical protein [Endozoicomonas sp. SCSIO W0465]|uniref:hypothetical protein n=1 Tax=Endozoicomonas sp. SCSIO W0465 TaxID=2918516 RepID=UPI00207564D8|nr:hypothetical protein [Endozoicomonas sp. SCSIO W0465]USE38741.1 hypothetical protein MJO57_11545 [Endozoicomonas sp. SCSIO W0465]
MLANIVEKWCLRGWYKNQKIPDLCGGAEQLQIIKALVGFQTATGLNIAEALYLQRLSAYCPVMLLNPCFS